MKQRAYNVLVVDWDFFFPIDNSWDWAHGESHLLTELMWPLRAIDFLERGQELPEVLPTWAGFWHRFRYAFGAKCYVADSNAFAYQAVMLDHGDHLDDTGVFLFDQHHDCGYQGEASLSCIEELGTFSCEDWMLALSMMMPAKNLHVIYPEHRLEALAEEPEPPIKVDRRFDHELPAGYLPKLFDTVFLCRSGGWVPPWEDEKFLAFLDACPVTAKMIWDLPTRQWNRELVDDL